MPRREQESFNDGRKAIQYIMVDNGGRRRRSSSSEFNVFRVSYRITIKCSRPSENYKLYHTQIPLGTQKKVDTPISPWFLE